MQRRLRSGYFYQKYLASQNWNNLYHCTGTGARSPRTYMHEISRLLGKKYSTPHGTGATYEGNVSLGVFSIR
jgi:hypothetical protein